MSHYKDEHMIISCPKKAPLQRLRDRIHVWIANEYDIDEVPDYSNYLSNIMSLGLSEHYLFIPPDCSKEGWTTSQAMDEVRSKIRAYIIKHNAKGVDKMDCILVTYEPGVMDESQDKLTAEWVVKK